MSIKGGLKIGLALAGAVVGTFLLAIFSFLQTLGQSVFVFLGLVGSNVLSMVLFPLQIATFPLWVMFYLVVDTAVVVYAMYLWWWSARVPEVYIVDKKK